MDKGEKRTTALENVTESDLRAYNIPEDLVQEAGEVKDSLQNIADVDSLEQAQKKVADVQEKIEQFLEVQELTEFGKIDIKLMMKLVNSNISTAQIGSRTGVGRMTIWNLRNGKTNVGKVSLRVAYQLCNYAQELTEAGEL